MMPSNEIRPGSRSVDPDAGRRRAAAREAGHLDRRARAMPPLFCEDLGNGPERLVFLHGVGGTTRYWRARVLALAVDQRLTLVDLLGFGRSPKPFVRYTVERHVAALHEVLGPRAPFTIVGHSFGAIAAVAYAARHPDQVERLVLLGLPYFGSELRALSHFRRGPAPERWLMTHLSLAALTCIVTRRVLGRALPYLLRRMPREVAEDLVRHTWRSSTSTLWEGVYRYDVARDMERLPSGLPVQLLHGDGDRTAPLDGVLRLAARHPGARISVLAGADHHVLLRDPEWVLAAIRGSDGVRGRHAERRPM